MKRVRSLGLVLLAAVATSACATTQTLEVGAFTYAHEVDPFSEEDRSYVATLSRDEDAALTWRCLEDGLNVIYHYGRYLAGDGDGEVLVRYRIDRGEASERAYWGLMQQQTAAWMPMQQVYPFTAEAMAGTEIALEVVDPADGDTIMDVFALDGLEAALPQLPCLGAEPPADPPAAEVAL